MLQTEFRDFERWRTWMQAPLFAHRSLVENECHLGAMQLCETRSPTRTLAAAIVTNGTDLVDVGKVRKRTIQESVCTFAPRNVWVARPPTALTHNEALVLVEDIEVAFQRVFGHAAPNDQDNLLSPRWGAARPTTNAPRVAINPFAPPTRRLTTQHETVIEFLERLPLRFLYQWEARRLALDSLAIVTAETLSAVRKHAAGTPQCDAMELALSSLVCFSVSEVPDAQFERFLSDCHTLVQIAEWLYTPHGPVAVILSSRYDALSHLRSAVQHAKTPAEQALLEQRVEQLAALT